MKPRFTILTLLGVTAYVAINTAAFLNPVPILSYLQFALAVTLVLAATVEAAGPSSARAVFCRGFVAATVLYGVFQLWEPSFYQAGRGALTFWVDITMFSEHTLMTEADMLAASRQSTIVGVNVFMTAGLAIGFLALWRYRALERREKNES
jgi:hypothetical protein